MSQKILIADDNENISEILAKYVKREGFIPIIAKTGLETIELFNIHNPALILLDVMMPFKNGFDVCKELRANHNVPIIIITAKSDDSDKIFGLNTGADDYIVKPFSPKEVIARIHSLLRRFNLNKSISPSFIVENLEIIVSDYKVIIDGNLVNLTKKEFEILLLLVENKNKVFTRDNLLNSIWGLEYEGETRNVDTNIKRLRKKLSEYNHPTWDIKTIWGVGYKFEVQNDKIWNF